MKTIGLLAVALVLLSSLCGCSRDGGPTVSFRELVSQPALYSGKTVTVDGIYVNGWEWTFLAGDITFTGSGDTKEIKPVGEAIWFSGFLPPGIRENLYEHYSLATDTVKYGKLRVTGIFETEGKYGNMNAYKYRITVEKVELLDWTPPE